MRRGGLPRGTNVCSCPVAVADIGGDGEQVVSLRIIERESAVPPPYHPHIPFPFVSAIPPPQHALRCTGAPAMQDCLLILSREPIGVLAKPSLAQASASAAGWRLPLHRGPASSSHVTLSRLSDSSIAPPRRKVANDIQVHRKEGLYMTRRSSAHWRTRCEGPAFRPRCCRSSRPVGPRGGRR